MSRRPDVPSRVRTLEQATLQTGFCRFKAEEIVAIAGLVDGLVIDNVEIPGVNEETLLTALSGVLQEQAEELVDYLRELHGDLEILCGPAACSGPAPEAGS